MNEAVCEKARLARDARFDGRFFIGVTTTGIYCRPICPSPPARREHVRYFPSAAAAAEAGFRPCLRCRPEAAPGTPAWNGSASSVSRALRLIGEGALDEGSVEDLAARLGIGARHLRRLFLRHLGASPVAVAQTRRVHFARKLIDETGLPMTEIALAAGFASIRRFNATFQNLYGRSPREFRRASAAAPRDHTPGHYTLLLAYRPPYKRNRGAGYRRKISVEGRTGRIAVRPVRGRHCLQLTIEFPEPAALFKIVTRARRLFDLDRGEF